MEYKEIIKDSYYHDKTGMLLMGDCLEWMKKFPDKSIDMVLCDLPYGTTQCKWDVVIPFNLLWEQYERIIKDKGIIALFGSEPFSSALRMSNIKLFKYDWIWRKARPNGFLNAKKMPMKAHEIISIFYKKSDKYYPQNLILKDKQNKNTGKENVYGKVKKDFVQEVTYTNYPHSVLEFKNPTNPIHPTQKPIDLCEYLIKTYTNKGEIVLDNTAGVCTTAVACKNNERRWICIEKEQKYCDISVSRIKDMIK